MTGDCHVRFCESQGLQCPWPLAKTVKKKIKKISKHNKKK
jgi:hypothetical protein